MKRLPLLLPPGPFRCLVPLSWTPVNPDEKSYTFTPAASGTYHFRIEYTDRCGFASTDITVITSTRTRAVRH